MPFAGAWCNGYRGGLSIRKWGFDSPRSFVGFWLILPCGLKVGWQILALQVLVRVQAGQFFGDVTQWSEYPPFKRRVVGSSPTVPIFNFWECRSVDRTSRFERENEGSTPSTPITRDACGAAMGAAFQVTENHLTKVFFQRRVGASSALHDTKTALRNGACISVPASFPA